MQRPVRETTNTFVDEVVLLMVPTPLPPPSGTKSSVECQANKTNPAQGHRAKVGPTEIEVGRDAQRFFPLAETDAKAGGAGKP